MPAENTSLELQFIRHPESGVPDILEAVTEFFSEPERGRRLLQQTLAVGEKGDLHGWIRSMPQAWPADVQALVNAALPYEKASGRALRDFLDEQPVGIRNAVAAYLCLGSEFGVFARLKGNHLQQLVRKAWLERGLAEAPVQLTTSCPHCGKPANCQSVLKKWNGLTAASAVTDCSYCGYHEDVDFEKSWRYDQSAEYPDAAQLLAQFQSIIAKQDARWLAARAPVFLQQLHAWLAALERQLVLDAQALSAKLDAMNNSEYRSPFGYKTRGSTMRIYGHGSFELRSNIEKGVVSRATREGRSYGPERPLDTALDELLYSEFVHHTFEVPDVAVHWRTLLDEQCCLLTDALANQDVAKAASCACAIVFNLDIFGLVCPLGFRLEHPPASVVAVAEQERLNTTRAIASTLVHVGATPLVEFLADGLAGFGVTSSDVQRLLADYWTPPSISDSTR